MIPLKIDPEQLEKVLARTGGVVAAIHEFTVELRRYNDARDVGVFRVPTPGDPGVEVLPAIQAGGKGE